MHNRPANDLFLFHLKKLIENQRRINYGRHGNRRPTSADNDVEIPEADFIEKARQMKLGDVKSFYNSQLFRVHRFSYNPETRMIRQTV